MKPVKRLRSSEKRRAEANAITEQKAEEKKLRVLLPMLKGASVCNDGAGIAENPISTR